MTVAAGSGFGGKPRPALVIQSDEFQELTTVTLALFTTDLTGATLRPLVEAHRSNGLMKTSELMVDLPITVRREKVGEIIGRLSDYQIIQVDNSLRAFLGLS